MPSEIGNQSVRGSGGAAPGARIESEAPNQLIVVTFEDASQAQGLYEALVDLDKKKVVHLEDAVFVSKNADGELAVDEIKHNEKRSGAVKGAVLGTLVGVMLGGPLLGLAGGAVVGRMIGKRMDLGIDNGTVQSISQDLENGHTALFILGSARHAPSVLEAFSKYHGKIVQTTVDTAVQERLQNALDSENAK